MKKIVRLTESELVRLVKKIIKEGAETTQYQKGDILWVTCDGVQYYLLVTTASTNYLIVDVYPANVKPGSLGGKIGKGREADVNGNVIHFKMGENNEAKDMTCTINKVERKQNGKQIFYPVSPNGKLGEPKLKQKGT